MVQGVALYLLLLDSLEQMGLQACLPCAAAHLQHAVWDLQAADLVQQLPELGRGGDVVDLDVVRQDANVGAIATLSWTAQGVSAAAKAEGFVDWVGGAGRITLAAGTGDLQLFKAQILCKLCHLQGAAVS